VELNRIEDENHYGWPFLLANGEPDPAVSPASGETDSAEPAKTAIPPALIHESKEIAVALAFYLGNQFPEPYRHDAFVAFRDSTIRRLRFDEAGQPIEFEN